MAPEDPTHTAPPGHIRRRSGPVLLRERLGVGSRSWHLSTRRRLTRSPGIRTVRRMPRLQVYLPDDLYAELKRRELPASELLQVAVRAEIDRLDALAATDRYLTELTAEVGEPSARDRARAREIVRRIQAKQLPEAG